MKDEKISSKDKIIKKIDKFCDNLIGCIFITFPWWIIIVMYFIFFPPAQSFQKYNIPNSQLINNSSFIPFTEKEQQRDFNKEKKDKKEECDYYREEREKFLEIKRKRSHYYDILTTDKYDKKISKNIEELDKKCNNCHNEG